MPQRKRMKEGGRHVSRMSGGAAATIIAETPPSALGIAEISREAVEDVRKAVQKRGYTAASKHVTEEMLNSFTISGNAEHIAEVFQLLLKLGADEIVFGPPYGQPLVRSIHEVVRAWEHL